MRIRSLVLTLLSAATAPLVVHSDTGAQHQSSQTRPITLGTSGGNFEQFFTCGDNVFCSSGTLGALLEDGDDTLYILSNNHVLSRDINDGVGGLVTQPGLVDAGCNLDASDAVGAVQAFVPLIFGNSPRPALGTPVPADYDGDGLKDPAVYEPQTGTWFIQQSQEGFLMRQFGFAGVVPVPCDYDNDGKDDIAVFDPGSGTWFLLRTGLGFTTRQFGFAGVLPVPGDFDGDDFADIAVYDPVSATWFIMRSNLGFVAQQFGFGGVQPVASDYDGDGQDDVAVWAPDSGTWFILQTTDGFISQQFGFPGVQPVPANYDGNQDDAADIAVWDPSSGVWFLLRSTEGFTTQQFGFFGVSPVPCDYDGDERDDVSVYDSSQGTWFLLRSQTGFASLVVELKNTADAAIAAAFAGQVDPSGVILDIGVPGATFIDDPATLLGTAVMKSGRTTGLTFGTLEAVDVTISVCYDACPSFRCRRRATFVNQLRVTPGSFSDSGDSGSLVVENSAECPRAVGLLFAGSTFAAFVNPIGELLSGLNNASGLDLSFVGCSSASVVTSDTSHANGGKKSDTRSKAAPMVPLAAIKAASRAKAQIEASLLRRAEVQGLGVGRSDAGPVVEVYVTEDDPAVRRNMPLRIDGFPVRVIETGMIRAY